MGKHISQLSAAGSLTGSELAVLSRLSPTIVRTATTLSALASDNSYNDSANGFVTAGFAVHMAVQVAGFTGSGANNIYSGIITALTASKMTIGGTDGDVIVDDAAGETVTITAWESVRGSAQLIADLGKAYTDSKLDGRAWKQPVRFRTTANVNLAGGGLAAGTTHDGVTAVAGDRALVPSQTAGAENGIYIVPASGAASRASDADTAAEILQATVPVEEGTTYADSQWTCSTNAPITLGTTALVFVPTGTATTYSADESTLHLSGTTFSQKDDGTTNAKLANMANSTIKGRTTAGSGDPEDLTAAQAAAIVQGDGSSADLVGFRGIPNVSYSANHTCVLSEMGRCIEHPSTDNNARTFTIDSVANQNWPSGAALTFKNEAATALSIAVTSQTLTLAGTTTTGTRTLAQGGVCTAHLNSARTNWSISGPGLT